MTRSSRVKTRGAASRPASSPSRAAANPNPLAREWRHIPKLVIFDLDFTLWLPEMYELDGAPFRKNPTTGIVTDRAGEQVRFFPAVNSVLSVLELDQQFRDATEVAVASRTTEPQWAKTCMRLLDVEFTAVDGSSSRKASLQSVVDYEAIYPRNKRAHFAQLKEESGVEYSDMLFFDNEYGNIRDINALGVVCAYCPNGLSDGAWLQGMEAFQQAKQQQ